jgi:S-formylglutathione hydrolase FrmB
MRRAITALAATVALAAAQPAAATPSFTDGEGLHVVSSRALDDRLYEVKVATDALRQPVDIRILLPAGYDASATTRYPVLYLFHGTSGAAADWTVKGDAEAITAGLPLIVVMPDAGYNSDGGGWFTNWFNGGAGGRPMWETFHIDQVIPFVDRTLRTIAERRGRAIYGLSQGGFGSLTYASRHPDLFLAAGAYSGAAETTADLEAQALSTPIIQGTAFGLDGAPPDSMFGPRASQQINWAAHDPGVLASNLRGMDLRLYTGNGSQGPLDPEPNPGAGLIEAGVHELTLLFRAHLEALDIPSFLRDYGPGTHAWPYWQRDLRETVGPLMDEFAHPGPAPARVGYRSAENRWSVWGYDVAMHRPAREFSSLQSGTISGFSLSGSGSATVTTPGVYQPGSAATVRVEGEREERTDHLTAGDDGRLRIEVPLGPGNPEQQYTAAALLRGTRVFTTRVRIDGVARTAAAKVKKAARKRKAAHRRRATRRCATAPSARRRHRAPKARTAPRARCHAPAAGRRGSRAR